MTKSQNLLFIGAGNMGSAIIRGLLKSGVALASQITAIDTNRELLGEFRDKVGVKVDTEAVHYVEKAALTVLAVKPQMMDDLLASLGDVGEKTILSIAAGVKIDRIREKLGGKAHVIRCMPNTPAIVGEGISAICPGPGVTDNEMKLTAKILGAVGRTVVVKNEKLMDAVTGLSGSGPAYAFMVIEALADGGVLMGLDRATALELAAQTLLGAAKMVLETGRHPGQLKDMVTSPGGTTAAALEVLEGLGVRGAFISAVRAATEKSIELGEK